MQASSGRPAASAWGNVHPPSATLDEIKTRPTRPAHRPIRSNRRRRLLAAFRKRAGLARESAKFASICNLFRDAESGCNSHPRRPRPRRKPCRRCRRSFPRNSLQSRAMGPRPVAARVVSAEAGGAIEPPRPIQTSETARPLPLAPAAPQGSVTTPRSKKYARRRLRRRPGANAADVEARPKGEREAQPQIPSRRGRDPDRHPARAPGTRIAMTRELSRMSTYVDPPTRAR